VPEVVLRPARAGEAAGLSELAMRSKAHWGYSPEFLAACRDELTVDPVDIEAGRVVVATRQGYVVGFSIVTGERPVAELEMLFVEPEHIGTRVGARLFEALCATAVADGFTVLHIESDPYALGFYEGRGAIRVAEAPSASIPGRTLPLLELDLTVSWSPR
jgi:GNAT superfamily N-acetyltransferase